MKVGTDGVSLGAIAPCPPMARVLDVGCGCGLIGLMMAQRGADSVVMLDIDPHAASEAAENAANSPWNKKISTLCCDFREYRPSHLFDSIVCNPPFFANGLHAPDARRDAARHDNSLPADAFMKHAVSMLDNDGTICIILPADRLPDWQFAAQIAGIKIIDLIELHTKNNAPPRRIIATFSRKSSDYQTHKLNINSNEYKNLTAKFYL